MKAEQTVMSNKKLQLLGQQYEDELPTYDLNHYLLKAQAEITGKIMYDEGFKAGMEKEAKGGTNALSYLRGVEEGEKRGIREGVRRAYQFMTDQHYVVGYDLDHAVDFLEKKYGKPSKRKGG